MIETRFCPPHILMTDEWVLSPLHICVSQAGTKIIPGGYPAEFQSVRGFISFTVCVPSSSERPQHEPFSMCKSSVLKDVACRCMLWPREREKRH